MKRAHHLVNSEPSLGFNRTQVRACLHGIDACEGFALRPGTVAVAFVDRQKCSQLHADFFGDPDVTDVMTFPAEEDDHVGDIAVCPSVAWNLAQSDGVNFAHELTLYIVHGFLHLSGMEDHTAAGRRAMRKAERMIMAHLAEQGLIPEFSWNVAS